jgi:cobalamin biosynthetic protein CobC
MLEHGGRLRVAAQTFNIPLDKWLDLSTGIAPYGFDLPAIPPQAWSRLPEAEDDLVAAAQRYFGVESLLPVSGSQAAIQMLPRLRFTARVGIISPCYAEHAEAWRREGHHLTELSEGEVTNALEQLDVLVVVNPNNPTGRLFSARQLLDWHTRLASRGGWLVVDEAFMDPTPEYSLASHAHLPGLILLRSFGKFFAMAGARLGFVLAAPDLLNTLADALGPWPIAGPSRFIGTVLLNDQSAQQQQREQLLADAQRLAELLTISGLRVSGGCALFQWVMTEDADQLYAFLASHGILVRRFQQPPSLRFGLPPDQHGWSRLASALAHYRDIHS